MLPKVSSKWLFLLTALAAVFSAIARVAGQGSSLAYAFLATFGFIAACFASFGLLFFLARAVASIWYQPPSTLEDGSPFAEGQLPPQILPPRNPSD
ncbi:MAG: hypothetical protein AAGI63_03610 [Planctomycetota bacterium]